MVFTANSHFQFFHLWFWKIISWATSFIVLYTTHNKKCIKFTWLLRIWWIYRFFYLLIVQRLMTILSSQATKFLNLQTMWISLVFLHQSAFSLSLIEESIHSFWYLRQHNWTTFICKEGKAFRSQKGNHIWKI